MKRLFVVLVALLAGMSAANARATCQTMPVVMFMTTWCGYCSDADAFFRSHGVVFESIDVERSNDPRVSLWNRYDGVPNIRVEGRVVRGFDEAALRHLLCVVD